MRRTRTRSPEAVMRLGQGFKFYMGRPGGRCMMNVVPRPGSLSTSIVPP
jgi:hypothetical protein